MARRRRRGIGSPPAPRPAATSRPDARTANRPAPRAFPLVELVQLRPPPRSPADSAAQRSLRIGVCAAFFAAGATVAIIVVLSELSFHVPRPWQAVSGTAAACGVGVLVGLYAPGWIIRRRMRAERGSRAYTDASNDAAADVPVDLEFAGNLVAAALIVTALTGALVGGGALLLEDFRRVLCVQLFIPPSARSATLLTLALGATAAGAAVATVALVALHGWYRAVTAPDTDLFRLWRGLALAVAVGGAAAWCLPTPAARVPVALAGISAAALLAARRESGFGVAPVASGAARPRRGARAALFGCAAAATGVAAALLLVLADSDRGLPAVGGMVALAGGGAWLGLALGRSLARHDAFAGPRAQFLAGVLLAALLGGIAVSPGPPASAALFFVVCAVGAAGMVVVGRSLAREHIGVQRALVALGGMAATGFSLGAAVPLLIGAPHLKHARGAASRTDGVAPPGVLATQVQAAIGSRRAALGTAHLASGPWGSLPADRDAWRIDLGGPRFDVLWVTIAAGTLTEAQEMRRDLRRVLLRGSGALRRRGQLLLELPSPAALSPPWLEQLLTPAERDRARVVHVERGRERLTVLILGNGGEAWWAAVPLPPGVTATVAPLPKK